MEEMNISAVSQQYGVSTRMLRYYEQIGLLRSYRKMDYAYRMYDENAITQLRQILILRKLRLSLKQIRIILQTPDAKAALKIFQDNIAALRMEINSLSEIRHILEKLAERLAQATEMPVSKFLTQDEGILASVATLPPCKMNGREEPVMEQINRMENVSGKLMDVRIVYLPPVAVASAHFIGDEPETKVGAMIEQFVKDYDLIARKPDFRHFGFNHPNPKDESGDHGYEMWVTIPEDMEVQPPFVKKRFPGGLYAAHAIAMGNFHEWCWLMDWVKGSDEYIFAGDMEDQDHMCGLLEEHLNYITHLRQGTLEPEGMQLDLLMPVKAK